MRTSASRTAGFAALMTPPEEGGSPPLEPSAFGDHVVAQSAAGAICAALLARERTGAGQRVTMSLLRAGVYTLGWDTGMALAGAKIRPQNRARILNPLVNCYRAADGAWFWLMLLQADRHWPDVCRAVDREDLRTDPRFDSLMARAQNAEALIAELDGAFATKTRAEWGAILDRENVWWAPVNTINEMLDDPVAQAAGAFVDVPAAEGHARMVASPADFSATPWQARGPAPEFGQHTEEVLLELGYDWERIAALKERAVIP
jgi:crotonobetainyl-CoA:carnitine CoA-transferase CaiB-like acyl-CoA transferase